MVPFDYKDNIFFFDNANRFDDIRILKLIDDKRINKILFSNPTVQKLFAELEFKWCEL